MVNGKRDSTTSLVKIHLTKPSNTLFQILQDSLKTPMLQPKFNKPDQDVNFLIKFDSSTKNPREHESNKIMPAFEIVSTI